MGARSIGTWERWGSSALAGAFWLARREMRRSWPTYPLGGLLLVLLGIFVVPSLSGIIELRGFGEAGRRIEEFYNGFFSDCLFLAICASFAVRVVIGNHALGRRDDFFAELRFFRKLPIPTGSLVGSRAVCVLFALFVNAPAFFGPLYVLSDFWELGASYLWFAGIWIGYGLATSGLYLLLELTDGLARATICSGFAAAFVVSLALLEWTFELGLVGRTAELAHGDYGPLFAVLSVSAGAAVFALLARVTGGRLKRWDHSA